MPHFSVKSSNKNSIDMLKWTAEWNRLVLNHTSTHFKSNINPYLLHPCLATQMWQRHHDRRGEEGENKTSWTAVLCYRLCVCCLVCILYKKKRKRKRQYMSKYITKPHCRPCWSPGRSERAVTLQSWCPWLPGQPCPHGGRWWSLCHSSAESMMSRFPSESPRSRTLRSAGSRNPQVLQPAQQQSDSLTPPQSGWTAWSQLPRGWRP